jgi:hypothetical protein
MLPVALVNRIEAAIAAVADPSRLPQVPKRLTLRLLSGYSCSRRGLPYPEGRASAFQAGKKKILIAAVVLVEACAGGLGWWLLQPKTLDPVFSTWACPWH